MNWYSPFYGFEDSDSGIGLMIIFVILLLYHLVKEAFKKNTGLGILASGAVGIGAMFYFSVPAFMGIVNLLSAVFFLLLMGGVFIEWARKDPMNWICPLILIVGSLFLMKFVI